MVQRARMLIFGAASVVTLVVSGCSGATTPPSGPSTSAASPASPVSPTPSPTPSVARITATTEVKARTVDLTIDSPAVGQEVKVRLMLPADFETKPDATYPVLYLLHGCCDTYESWDISAPRSPSSARTSR